jgi:N-methylhydantoinase B
MDAQGRHRFTVVAKAHQADCGNSIPTTYMGSAKDVYEEGALIFPAVQVQRGYQNIDDIVRMCRMRIRVPDQWWGDYLAMVGAARIGERELLALAQEVGWDTLDAHAREFFDYSEQRMIAAIQRLQGGSARSESTHDRFFDSMPEGGVTIGATVTIDTERAKVTVDLTDNPDCLPIGLNLSEACARTASMVGVFNSVDHQVPKNAGSFRRIDVKLRRGCIVGIPEHPTSCSVATTNIADRVANSVQTAIASIGDGMGLAECGAVIPPAVGVISGVDPDTQHPFVNQLFLGFSGGAGAPEADCWQTIAHVGNAGLCFQDSIELDEMRHPIYVHRRSFMPDTEGAGRHTGARSIFVEFGPLRGSLEVGYVSDGAVHGPKGVRGGLSGAPAAQSKRRADGSLEDLPPCAQVSLAPGERILSYSCGGGGYGHPEQRAVEAIQHDLDEGYLSPDRAAQIYHVAFGADGRIDADLTRRRRQAP